VNETNLLRHIQLRASEAGWRLFRNNSGDGYVGTVVERTKEIIVLKDWRILHAGLCKGSSDLIGWAPGGTFAAFEGKSRYGKLRPEQEAFIEAVRKTGGIADVLRSESEFAEIVHERGREKIVRP
jgi:VRR-NUC domain